MIKGLLHIEVCFDFFNRKTGCQFLKIGHSTGMLVCLWLKIRQHCSNATKPVLFRLRPSLSNALGLEGLQQMMGPPAKHQAAPKENAGKQAA